MKNFYPILWKNLCPVLLVCALLLNSAHGQFVEVISNPATSANGVFGTNLYAANENIYTEAEIGAGNFTSAATAINQVAFNINVVGTNTTFNNVTIWMKEVPATTTSFVTGTYTTAGYTQVFTGSVTGTGHWMGFHPFNNPFRKNCRQ